MMNTDIEWQNYEELVKEIYEALGKAHGVTIECWGAKCRRTGKSGATYQIDVLTSHTDGVHQYQTAIECKYWDKLVGRNVISQLAHLVEDVQVNKGVAVSKMGFSRQAKMVAKANNIGLVELRQPTDEDWEGRIRTINFQIVMKQRMIRDLTLGIAPEPGYEKTVPSGTMPLHLPANQIFFAVPGGKVQTFQEFVDDQERNNPTATEFDVRLPEGTIVEVPGLPDSPIHGQRISSVSFRIEDLPPQEMNVVIHGEDHVHWIMEDLFGGTRHTIAPDGMITRNPSDEYEDDQEP